MEFTKLGKTGLNVSRICLGCMSYGDKSWQGWVLDADNAKDHFAHALDAGINFFDTADVYSIGVSEEITGRWLSELSLRDDIVIATKVHGKMGNAQNRQGLSRKHILEACDASLRRLKTDFIDLYQIHRFDFTTPIEETLEALDFLVRQGKVRYLGASSMATWQFQKMRNLQRENGWHPFVSMQNHYNLAYREEEREMIPYCIDQGVGILPWSPLARGFLSGSRKNSKQETLRAKTDPYWKGMYAAESDQKILDAVIEVADSHQATPAQVAVAWLLQAPGISAPIVGATQLQHITELIESIELKLTAGDLEKLEAHYKPHPVIGHAQPEAKRMLKS